MALAVIKERERRVLRRPPRQYSYALKRKGVNEAKRVAFLASFNYKKRTEHSFEPAPIFVALFLKRSRRGKIMSRNVTGRPPFF